MTVEAQPQSMGSSRAIAAAGILLTVVGVALAAVVSWAGLSDRFRTAFSTDYLVSVVIVVPTLLTAICSLIAGIATFWRSRGWRIWSGVASWLLIGGGAYFVQLFVYVFIPGFPAFPIFGPDSVPRYVQLAMFNKLTLTVGLPLTATGIFVLWARHRVSAHAYVVRAMPLRKLLFSFDGRIRRGEFWKAFVIVIFGLVVLNTLGLFVEGYDARSHWPAGSDPVGAARFFIGVGHFFLVISVLAISAKRLHDRGKSGWLALMNFVPVIGVIYILIECGVDEGDAGTNAYGPSPLQRAEPDKPLS